MATIPLSFISGGGGGSDEVTASSAQVLKGYTAITTDSNDEPKEGTIPLLLAQTIFANIADQIIYKGKYLSGDQTIKALSQINLSADNIKKGITVSVQNGNGDVFSVEGNYSTPSSGQSPVTADKMLSGYSGFVNGGAEVKGNIATQAGGTFYATQADQTIVAAQKYCDGNINVSRLTQSNLDAANIVRGKTISVNNGNTNVWSVAGNSNNLKMVSGTVEAQVTSTGDYQNDYLQIAPGITPVYGFCYNYNWNTDLTIYINGVHYRYGLVNDGGSGTAKYYKTISYTNTSSATRLYTRGNGSQKVMYFLWGY
jgi:hypothetical protein